MPTLFLWIIYNKKNNSILYDFYFLLSTYFENESSRLEIVVK